MKKGWIFGVAAFCVAIALAMVLYGISWIITCGIIKLITLCFGLRFKWSVATGIWLVMCITNHSIKHDRKK